MTPAARFLSSGGAELPLPRGRHSSNFVGFSWCPGDAFQREAGRHYRVRPQLRNQDMGGGWGWALAGTLASSGSGAGDLNLVAPCERAQRKAARSKRSSTLSECPEGRG